MMSVSMTYTCNSCDTQITIGPDEGLKDTWFTKSGCILCPECFLRLLAQVDKQIRKLVETDAKIFESAGYGRPTYREAAWLYSELALEICKSCNALHPDGAPVDE